MYYSSHILYDIVYSSSLNRFGYFFFLFSGFKFKKKYTLTPFWFSKLLSSSIDKLLRKQERVLDFMDLIIKFALSSYSSFACALKFFLNTIRLSFSEQLG